MQKTAGPHSPRRGHEPSGKDIDPHRVIESSVEDMRIPRPVLIVVMFSAQEELHRWRGSRRRACISLDLWARGLEMARLLGIPSTQAVTRIENLNDGIKLERVVHNKSCMMC